MTSENGQTVAGARDTEVADYVEAVREALRDLPAAERNDLLEDLPAHLAEVAAEDPAPLTERLGDPYEYAAELRAAADPAADPGGPTIPAWLAVQRERLLGRLRRLDVRVGPLIGYQRFSEFARLLVPAWWVLRGYLAAMIVVALLNRTGGELGLLPRLGGSTLAGWIILAVFVAGSIWLAHREGRMARWPRRALLAGTALLLLVGLVGAVTVDNQARWSSWSSPPPAIAVANPYGHVDDVYVIDEHGRPLTNVRLLDQNGQDIHLGRGFCGYEYDSHGEPIVRYPRCADDMPWWARPAGPQPSPNAAATFGRPAPPEATPMPAPEPSPMPAPEPSPTPSPEP